MVGVEVDSAETVASLDKRRLLLTGPERGSVSSAAFFPRAALDEAGETARLLPRDLEDCDADVEVDGEASWTSEIGAGLLRLLIRDDGTKVDRKECQASCAVSRTSTGG